MPVVMKVLNTMPRRVVLFLFLITSVVSFISGAAVPANLPLYSELIEDSDVKGNYSKPLPHTYINPSDLPDSFHWDHVIEDHDSGTGRSYLTRLLNQHIPQYCGSCWAHAAVSALQDRIKIFRNGAGEEINLSIQYILNCGRSAGSCHGGSMVKTYKFIKEESGFIPFETCQPYLACSHDSDEGFCPYVDTTCTPLNTCRTCDTFVENGGTCREIDIMPNATVAEYGVYESSDFERHQDFLNAVKTEIFARGTKECNGFDHSFYFFLNQNLKSHAALCRTYRGVLEWAWSGQLHRWSVRRRLAVNHANSCCVHHRMGEGSSHGQGTLDR